jgi:hypothetical protein
MNDNERWETMQHQDDTAVILHGSRIVGSMVRKCGRWRVEILWSGPSGDIKASFSDFFQALAFIDGVERTLMALGLHHPELKLGTQKDDLASGVDS